MSVRAWIFNIFLALILWALIIFGACGIARANPGLPEWWGCFLLLDGTEPDAWQEILEDRGNLIIVGQQSPYTLYYWVCHVPTLSQRVNIYNLHKTITSADQYRGRTYLELYQGWPNLAKRVLLVWDSTQETWISVYQYEQLYGSTPPVGQWRKPIIISGWNDEM